MTTTRNRAIRLGKSLDERTIGQVDTIESDLAVLFRVDIILPSHVIIERIGVLDSHLEVELDISHNPPLCLFQIIGDTICFGSGRGLLDIPSSNRRGQGGLS